MQEAEKDLGVALPKSFREFLSEFGAGQNGVVGWWIHSPSECYTFDFENGCCMRFVALAQDVCGNYLAFDPTEPESLGERSIYYVCHDPYGHAKIASSFEQFIRDAAQRGLKDEFVSDIPGNFVYEELEPRKAKRSGSCSGSWWKFWSKS